jgi:hypothetical protein
MLLCIGKRAKKKFRSSVSLKYSLLTGAMLFNKKK